MFKGGVAAVMMDRRMLLAAAAVVVCGAAFSLLYPSIAGGRKAQKRQAALMVGRAKQKAAPSTAQAKRRKAIAESLSEIGGEKKGRSGNLEERLTQAGLALSPQMFYAASGIFGLFLCSIIYIAGGDTIVALSVAPALAWFFPHWLISYRIKRRVSKFVDQFPEAIDVIIRGVKAGLPVSDCLRLIASEGEEPVRSEFKRIVDGLAIGMTVGEAVDRLAESVPVPEASFFAIALNIQQKAGGNLSETLANLSRVLRDRKKLKAKVKALSAEAKASAGIIGSLPFLVGAAVSFLNPGYMALLYTTNLGKICLVGGLMWMGIGVAIMRKMIDFDF